MPDVLICYAHPDRDPADRIARILDDVNVSYAREIREIEPGDPINQKVRETLAQPSAIVVIISPTSLRSPWVPFILGFAVGRETRLLPFITQGSIDTPTFMKDLLHTRTFDEVREFFSEWRPPAAAPKPPAQEAANAAFRRLTGILHALLVEMKGDLSLPKNSFVREFVALDTKGIIFSHNKRRFEYYADQHKDLQNQIDLLEEAGFVRVVQVSKLSKIYRMTEEFVALLARWDKTP